MTLRATVAETSSCRRTDTEWGPSVLIGLPRAMARRSTSSPATAARAPAISVVVTAPNRRPAEPALTFTSTGAASRPVGGGVAPAGAARGAAGVVGGGGWPERAARRAGLALRAARVALVRARRRGRARVAAHRGGGAVVIDTRKGTGVISIHWG